MRAAIVRRARRVSNDRRAVRLRPPRRQEPEANPRLPMIQE